MIRADNKVTAVPVVLQPEEKGRRGALDTGGSENIRISFCTNVLVFSRQAVKARKSDLR